MVSPEETTAIIERAAIKVWTKFRSAPGFFLDVEDLQQAVVVKFLEVPPKIDITPELLFLICFRAMLNYARACTPLSRSEMPIVFVPLAQDQYDEDDERSQGAVLVSTYPSPERLAIVNQLAGIVLKFPAGASKAEYDAAKDYLLTDDKLCEVAEKHGKTSANLFSRVNDASEKIRAHLKIERAA